MKLHITVILIEDNPDYRLAIEAAINRETDLELTKSFGAAEIAIRTLSGVVEGKQPDVTLLDLSLPGMNGLKAIPWLRRELPNTKIIILTQSDQESDVLKAISLGADGYLLKGSSISQITEGIRSTMEGNTIFDKRVAQFIIQTIRSSPQKEILQQPLSSRETEVLHLLGEGMLKKEIANELKIKFSTVATHVRHIYEKLQVENAAAAISKAYQKGLFSSNEQKK